MEVKPSKKWFDWHLDSHLERDEMLLGFDISKRSSDLLQNCDSLPHLSSSPLQNKMIRKLHLPPNNTIQVRLLLLVLLPMDHREGQGEGEEENANLLRALQLSQTRAREAEEKASVESGRKQELMRLLLEDSLRLSAYRRWVTLLEAEISMRQRKGSRLQKEEAEEEGFGDEGEAVLHLGTVSGNCWGKVRTGKMHVLINKPKLT